MSGAVLQSKYNMLSLELQQSLELYLEFLLAKMIEQNNSAPARKNLDFSIYNTDSKNWENPQAFIAEMRNGERF